MAIPNVLYLHLDNDIGHGNYMTIATRIGKCPISESLPVGSEIRNTPEFEQVQSEIDKLSTISGNCIVDWTQVISLCEMIITSRSKDLLVACYLAGGLFETQGLMGLEKGLSILSDMLQAYWDSLFPSPKRMRARRNALLWLTDRIGQKIAITSWQEQPVEGALIESILANLRAIDATLMEKDDEAPSMRQLISIIDGLPRVEAKTGSPTPDFSTTTSFDSVNAHGSAPSESPSKIESSQIDISRTLAASRPLDSNVERGKASDLLNERVSELVEWYQGIDLESPASYRLKRIALWSAIEALPPTQNGKSFIPGPSPQTVEIMKRLEAGGSPEEIIRFAENQLVIVPFWLDMNHLVAKALALGGSRFAPALEAVESETARFVGRLPKLSELSFINGYPFASESTIAWLRPLGSTVSSSGSFASSGDLLAQAIGEARTLAAAGKLVEAAARIQQEITLADSARKRFTLRLRLYEMLAAQGAQDKLRSFAKILLSDIDRFQLDEWEPKLALEGLKLAYHFLLSDPEIRAEAIQVLTRITLLDPAVALELSTTVSRS